MQSNELKCDTVLCGVNTELIKSQQKILLKCIVNNFCARTEIMLIAYQLLNGTYDDDDNTEYLARWDLFVRKVVHRMK